MKKATGPTAKRRAAKKRKADAEYRRNSLMVRERDGELCRFCGRPASEVHHIQPRSLGVNHGTDNLVCLCGICHRDVHGKRLTISGNADNLLVFDLR